MFFLLGAIQGSVTAQETTARTQTLIPEKSYSGTIYLWPGEYTITENYLSGMGRLTLASGKQKVKVVGKLASDTVEAIEKRQQQQLVLAVTGTIASFKEAENFAGFDEAQYYTRQKVSASFTIQQLHHWKSRRKIIASLKGWPLRLAQGLTARLPAAISSFYQSCFLGLKDDYFYQQQLLFSRSGLWQLFAFSGLQFLFLLLLFRQACLRLGVTVETTRILQLFVGLLLLIMLGFKVNLVRGLLFSFFLGINGQQRGSQHFSALDLWSLTLLALQFIFPWQLLSFAGQISYLLTFLWCCPLGTVPRQNFLLPFLVAPLFWWHFFEWTPWLLLSFWFFRPFYQKVIQISLVLLPFLWFLADTAVVRGVNYFYEILLGQLSWLTNWQLHWVVGRPPPALIVGYYSLFLLLLFTYRRYRQKLYLVLFLLSFLVVSHWSRLNPSGNVTFVNVRQGDSILLKSPWQQAVVLIDTGGRLNFSAIPQRSIASQTLIPYLKAQGIKKIHHVFLSHADADHMGDLVEVSQHFILQNVWLQPGATQQLLLATSLKALPKTTAIKPLATPQTFSLGHGNTLAFLGPTSGDGSNDSSIQLLGEIYGRRFLFTGDVEAKGEASFLQHYPHLKVDVLKIPHHGSKTSTTADFLTSLAPKLAVISCGEDNQYGHPAPDVLERLKTQQVKVYRTDEQGTILFPYTPFGWQEIRTSSP